jgi:hypothetical protein
MLPISSVKFTLLGVTKRNGPYAQIHTKVRFTSPFKSTQVKFFNGSELDNRAGCETIYFSRTHVQSPLWGYKAALALYTQRGVLPDLRSSTFGSPMSLIHEVFISI